MKLEKSFRIIMTVICFILTLAITLQIRTMTKKTSVVSSGSKNSELIDSLLEWQERYDKITKKLEKSSELLESEREEVSKQNQAKQEKADELKKYNLLLGLTDVSGEGITITAKDGTINKATDNISSYLVHDADLREIVNELANAGAEAISINDQRIVNTTSITCAGNIISINGEKVSSPFVIKAIGNEESLYGALSRPGGYIALMKEDLPVEIKKSSNIQIKKYTGAFTRNYIKNSSDKE